jgi:hypothetical protein
MAGRHSRGRGVHVRITEQRGPRPLGTTDARDHVQHLMTCPDAPPHGTLRGYSMGCRCMFVRPRSPRRSRSGLANLPSRMSGPPPRADRSIVAAWGMRRLLLHVVHEHRLGGLTATEVDDIARRLRSCASWRLTCGPSPTMRWPPGPRE